MKLVLSLLLVLAALGFSPAHAGVSRMQACTAQWRQQGLSKADYRPFLVRCLKGETAVVKISTAPKAMRIKPVKAKRTAHAADRPQADRMKQCGAQWRQMKALGTTGGLSYRQFAAKCLKKPV